MGTAAADADDIGDYEDGSPSGSGVLVVCMKEMDCIYLTRGKCKSGSRLDVSVLGPVASAQAVSSSVRGAGSATAVRAGCLGAAGLVLPAALCAA